MPWKDFRDFLGELDRRGQVRVVQDADPHLEIGTLTEIMCERRGPMLLFERIKGYPPEYRIAAKPYTTPLRSAIALGLPEEGSPFQMFRAWREKMSTYRPLLPEQVSSGPVMQQVREGQDVDLTHFPTPQWHELDGGLYFGTGNTVITRDPEEDWVNLGTYRCMIQDQRTLGFQIAPYHHGNLQMRKWWAQGKSCPVAVGITLDPYLFYASNNGLPWRTSEYDYAGFLKGEPQEVIKGPRTGLPLPAHAELVLEGEVPPPSEETREEGPFGEYTGYYAGDRKPRSIIRVRALYHRTNPILHGDPPLKPPHDTWGYPAGSILSVWDGLERAGVPGVKGVYSLNTGGGLITIVSVQQQYAGHARQVGRVASGLVRNMVRLLVVVDDDIDPSDPEEVLWAIATRSDPKTTFEVQEDCPSTWLDPMMPPEQKERGPYVSNRALIVACRPWHWKDQFPIVNRASDALKQETFNKWRSLFEEAIPVPASVAR